MTTKIGHYSAGFKLLKVNNRKTRIRCEIRSKLRIKTPERRQWRQRPVRDHTFMTSTRKGGGGVLKFVTCLRMLFFLNNRSIVHFCGWWGVGGSKNWSFFVDVING